MRIQLRTMANSIKRQASIPPEEKGAKKSRDVNGFRLKQQDRDKVTLTAYEQLGGENYKDETNTISQRKTIQEEETEGASYLIEGRLRKVPPYFFTYLTYCKLRWRDRKLMDIFVNEFRDKNADFYEKAIEAGQVTLNKKPANLDSVVRNGDLISHRAHRHEPSVSSKPIKIIFENDDIIAIDKPSGIPVHPTGRYRFNTITKIFQHEYGKTVHPCNRLDRLTSGLMFLGKNAQGANKFVQQIKDRTVRKYYLARVVGKFPLSTVVEKPLSTISPKLGLNRVDEKNGKEAKTEFKRISYDKESNTSIVKCQPLTGRTHQIRVHLQFLGHPIANDPIYSNEDVWGPNLGKNDEGDNDFILKQLDRYGKDLAVSTWFHKQADGEVLSGEKCSLCSSDLYTDPGPNDLELWLHAYKYESSTGAWSYQTEYPDWALEPHKKYLEMAIKEAEKCGETTTQFNVGAVLVHDGEVISTGHTRELEGNTHAEQCALDKYHQKTGSNPPPGTELYTSMEPCTFRLSGNKPCTDRILDTDISTVFVGVVEPKDFVENNTSISKLEESGVDYIHIPGYEKQCIEIAKKGHN